MHPRSPRVKLYFRVGIDSLTLTSWITPPFAVWLVSRTL